MSKVNYCTVPVLWLTTVPVLWLTTVPVLWLTTVPVLWLKKNITGIIGSGS